MLRIPHADRAIFAGHTLISVAAWSPLRRDRHAVLSAAPPFAMVSPRLLEVLDRLQEGVVWAMLAWLPFAFGGVLPLSHMVLVGGTAILALLFGLRCVVGRAAVVGSWSLVPLLLFVALVAVQAMPGSGDLLQGVAPENHRLWTELAGAPALDAGLGAVSLSLNPTATRTDLRLLLALAALFALVANVMRDRGALRRLLTAV